MFREESSEWFQCMWALMAVPEPGECEPSARDSEEGNGWFSLQDGVSSCEISSDTDCTQSKGNLPCSEGEERAHLKELKSHKSSCGWQWEVLTSFRIRMHMLGLVSGHFLICPTVSSDFFGGLIKRVHDSQRKSLSRSSWSSWRDAVSEGM